MLALLALTVTAAVTDVRSRRIPNWLTLSGVIAGFLLNMALGGTSGLKLAATGFGLALLIHVPLFALRVTGGGDVKLMAAAGAILGPRHFLELFILAALAGGVHALTVIYLRRAMGGVFWNLLHMAKAAVLARLPYQSRPELDISHRDALTIPRGLSVAIGAILLAVFVHSS
jgi:prepilin peptidase CpaA